ncbi:hypothetical protein C0993_003703, partial [Termitomyces sp. T159_Od127]
SLYDGGTFEDYLKTGVFLSVLHALRRPSSAVKTWLDANPNEGVCLKHTCPCLHLDVPTVLSILIVNIDNAPASAYGSVYTAAGVDVVSYAPPTSPVQASSWPTLGSMIDSGKRLVTFMDNQADLTAVPYIIDGCSLLVSPSRGILTSISQNLLMSGKLHSM